MVLDIVYQILQIHTKFNFSRQDVRVLAAIEWDLQPIQPMSLLASNCLLFNVTIPSHDQIACQLVMLLLIISSLRRNTKNTLARSLARTHVRTDM